MEIQLITNDEWEKWLEMSLARQKTTVKTYGLEVKEKRFAEDFFYTGEVSLQFRNCVFEKKFTLASCELSCDLFIYDCIFNEGISIGNVTSQYKIIFLRCKIDEKAVFWENNIQRLDLNLTYANYITFDDISLYDYIQIGGMDRNKINELILHTNSVVKRLEVNHADINMLRIANSNLESDVIVANCNINNLSFENFRNNGHFKFLNCRSLISNQPSKMVINQSNMGKTEFFKFNFASFSSVNITNSLLIDSLFINCKWFDTNMISKAIYFSDKLETEDDSKKETRADNMKEVYKQIKFSLSKQGDNVQEQYFHGLEMKEYDKSISYSNNFWTKIILKLSYLTSNYGQSLLRPVLFLFGISSLLFWCMYISGGTRFTSYNLTSLRNYPDTFASILNFMNPLRKYDNDLKSWPLIIDIFSRVFSSYLLYNIIRATRRFVK